MLNPILITSYQVYILLAQLITDDTLIDHLAEIVLVMYLCNKVIVLCPLSILSSLEESHDVVHASGVGSCAPLSRSRSVCINWNFSLWEICLSLSV